MLKGLSSGGADAGGGEMGGDMGGGEPAVDDRPLDVRLIDNDWKARKSAYSELAGLLKAEENGRCPSFGATFEHRGRLFSRPCQRRLVLRTFGA